MKIKSVKVQQSGKQKKHDLSFMRNSEPNQTSKMELFQKIAKDLMPLSFLNKVPFYVMCF